MNEMATFVRVVETGSFAAAADALGLSPSAVSKIISRIEDRLRLRLLTRSTRKLALTGEGQIYLDHARSILGAIEAVETQLSSLRGRPSGVLRVNTGTAIGKHQLVPNLPRFLERFPDITIELSVTDRQIDVVAENVDVVLRTGRLADSELHAIRIGEGRRQICASPAYLERHGRPQTPADLLRCNCLLTHLSHLARWPFVTPEGINRLQVKGDVVADNADMLLDLALAGHGIVRLGNLLTDEHIRQGRLVSLLDEFHADEPFPIWAVMPPGRFRLHRMQVFLDFLGDVFSSQPSSSAP